ncbi:MAG: hypothetical protein GY895_14160 [Phycisphaera sp.]|nr:hypothetical protein [Phycisphaera sp.]
MTEQKNALAGILAACSKDEALKARFISDPKAALKERGLDVRNVRKSSHDRLAARLTRAGYRRAGLVPIG